MTVETTFEVAGLKQALSELSRVDRRLRLQITRDFKVLTNPLVADIRSQIPQKAPLSGMSRVWVIERTGFQMFPWNGTAAMTMVKQSVSAKKPKEFAGIVRNLAVFAVKWQGMANTVYDMAGRKNKSLLGDKLAQEHGRPSRIMYPAFERHEGEIQQGMLDIVEKVGNAVNRNLKVTPK
jgi:hypothetical protein